MKWLVSVGGIAIAMSAILVFWSSYGWITIPVYALDKKVNIAAHKNQITQQSITDLTKIMETIAENQTINRDEWMCDELDEEIPELQKDYAAAVTKNDQIDIQRIIDKKEEVWGKLDCSKFTE